MQSINVIDSGENKQQDKLSPIVLIIYIKSKKKDERAFLSYKLTRTYTVAPIQWLPTLHLCLHFSCPLWDLSHCHIYGYMPIYMDT